MAMAAKASIAATMQGEYPMLAIQMRKVPR